MKQTKWIADTKTARRVHKKNIVDYRLNQKEESFELKIEYDDGKSIDHGAIMSISSPIFSIPSVGYSSELVYYDEHIEYIDPKTCATKDDEGFIVFAEKSLQKR